MAAPRKYDRLNVYLAPGLRERMRKAGKVPWSRVAQQAFEKKLGELATAKERKNMSDVIQRLRASRLESQGHDRKDGFQAGTEWASDTAEAVDLQRVERALEAQSDGEPYIVLGGSAYCGAEYFFFTISPDDRGDRAEAKDFWEQQLGDSEYPPSDEFVQGFADGACDVWRSVQGKI